MAKKIIRRKHEPEEGGRLEPSSSKKFYGRARGLDARYRSGLSFGKTWAEYDRSKLTAEQFEAIEDDAFVQISESKPRNFGEE